MVWPHTPKSDRDPVIVSAARTPVGKFMGALASLPATRLGALAVREAVKRAGIDAAQIDEVLLGTSSRRARVKPRRGKRRSWPDCPIPSVR